MLEKILGKKSKVKILRFLISNYEQEYCLDNLVKATGMSCGTIHPALGELVDTRVVIQRKVGRSTVYKINKSHIFFNKIKELIETEKNSFLDIAKEFTSNFSKDYISAVILFGSVARGDFNEKSDIDLLIVYNSEKAKKQIRNHIDKILDIYDILIIPIFLSSGEIEERIRRFDNFIITVINEGKLLYGEASWLKK